MSLQQCLWVEECVCVRASVFVYLCGRSRSPLSPQFKVHLKFLCQKEKYFWSTAKLTLTGCGHAGNDQYSQPEDQSCDSAHCRWDDGAQWTSLRVIRLASLQRYCAPLSTSSRQKHPHIYYVSSSTSWTIKSEIFPYRWPRDSAAISNAQSC